MFSKILVVEDLEIANYGIIKTLVDKNIVSEEGISHTQYCDKALLKIKKAIIDKRPFELIITDLSFDKNQEDETIKSGEELIEAIKGIHPHIKVIVYSVEDRVTKIKSLFDGLKIDGFVSKGGSDSRELLKAISEVYDDRKYPASYQKGAFTKNNSLELDDYHRLLLKKLSEGYSQKEIRLFFEENNISPNSRSIIEKKLEKLKDDFNAKSALHLIAILKDQGLI